MNDNRNDLGAECRHFINRFKTLILATTDEKGVPDASTAPYFLQDGCFYIFVSQLAKHTSHLLQSGRCAVFFLEDEKDAINLFARKRLTISCEAVAIDREQSSAKSILDSMAARFGPTMGMLRQLPDFFLICLQPQSCNYVRGFGQAFRFAAQEHPEMWKASE